MSRFKVKIREFFVYVVPVGILLDLMTYGHWHVEYFHEGVKYTSSRVYGFPFPSSGNFTPIQWYNSGDDSLNYFTTTLNAIILLSVSGFIYYFLLRKHINGKYLWSILAPFIYLLGFISLLSCIGLFGSHYEWVNEFKIINYHFWWVR